MAQLAAARQGTHSTKTRGEVRGGGAKPYRQKGTGRARQGSTRAPQFAGGGVVHGPTPRDYAQRTPKKMKAAALRGALSDRARNGRVHVVAGLRRGRRPVDRRPSRRSPVCPSARHVLVVAQRGDELTWKSLRNAERVHLLVPDQLNTYDVLVSDDVVFTTRRPGRVRGRPAARGSSAKGSATEAEAQTRRRRRGCLPSTRTTARRAARARGLARRATASSTRTSTRSWSTRTPTRPRSRSRSSRSSASRSTA